MRPKSQKDYERDWYRNRRYRAYYGEWEKRPLWAQESEGNRSMMAFYPAKEARTKGNRAVRRYKDIIPNGCAYKKIYDVPWDVI